MNAQLPPSNSALLRPYLESIVTALQSHA
jgi:hypothetical protein